MFWGSLRAEDDVGHRGMLEAGGEAMGLRGGAAPREHPAAGTWRRAGHKSTPLDVGVPTQTPEVGFPPPADLPALIPSSSCKAQPPLPLALEDPVLPRRETEAGIKQPSPWPPAPPALHSCVGGARCSPLPPKGHSVGRGTGKGRAPCEGQEAAESWKLPRVPAHFIWKPVLSLINASTWSNTEENITF